MPVANQLANQLIGMNQMLKIFRIVSILEGVSFLLILSVTMDFISREFVFVLGMGHGAIFLVYFILSLLVSHKQSWSVTVWVLVLLAAFIPFAFIPVELFLKKELGKSQQIINQTG